MIKNIANPLIYRRSYDIFDNEMLSKSIFQTVIFGPLKND